MAFPLMPFYDAINVVAYDDLDPDAVVRDRELGERIREYGKICPAGSPDFALAVQRGAEWRIIHTGACEPASARYGLAAHLRRGSDREHDPALVRAMLRVADRLDPEDGEQVPKDEWEIGDRRYRVIRIERFTLINKSGMEPPRASDVEPPKERHLLEGHLIDPLAPAGQWEAQLRLNLVTYLPPAGGVPPQVALEARHAVRSHPAVVLLPPEYTIVEIRDGGRSWEPFGGGHGPLHARDWLAAYFSELLPRLREFQGSPGTEEEQASWRRAADRVREMPGPDFLVAGRHFRTVRVSRMLRLSTDGPEPPRPSDQERYGYVPPPS
ncbi:DUF5954 family protein [Actinomadura kijaniata]|uniref:DUF5954 family protein n=1 Tax=Actinomadura kijaniata TaxID=46161 RepID=UPI00083593CF|nr:DUF5954 family protein [Actinomadura kijaniata]